MKPDLTTPTAQERVGFSQQDPRIVQRQPGEDAPGPEGVVPGRPVERYAPTRATPGKFDENWVPTNQSASIGGNTLLIDKDLGFMAHTVLVDNWTNQWLKIDGIRRSVPPYTGGWVFNSVQGVQQGRVALAVPSTQMTSAGVLAGEYVWVAFAEAVLPPSNGVGPGSSSASGASGQLVQQFFESSANINAGNTFTGITHDTGNNAAAAGSGYSRFRAFAFMDQPGSLITQQSRDGATWRTTLTQAVAASAAQVTESITALRFVRVQLQNTGAVATTVVEFDSELVAI